MIAGCLNAAGKAFPPPPLSTYMTTTPLHTKVLKHYPQKKHELPLYLNWLNTRPGPNVRFEWLRVKFVASIYCS